MSRVPSASAVGSISYAIVCTRSHLSDVTIVVKKYMANLGKKQWQAVKWIFIYMKGPSVSLVFIGGSGMNCIAAGYVHSNFPGDLERVGQHVMFLTLAGGHICWRFMLQPTIALLCTL